MTIDPDEQPTRYGGPPPSAPPGKRPDDPTGPAFDAKGKKGAAPPAARNGNNAGAAPAAVSNDPLVGKELGGCRLERLLGRGAMGAVYKARQVKLDRDVAVKIIRPEMMTDQRMLKRFEVEARTVGKFNSANVVMVHDVGFELGLHWLVMEFVSGKNLRDHVKLLAGGRLPAGEALPLLRQAIKGLEEAQRLSVVHRDIKPDNLMLTDRGVLKIADFGIAKPLQEDFSMTLTSELVGTPLYMSPEQCQGEAELDFRSDMYSLGATFYYLLTGEPPIRASSVYELIQTKTKLANLCLWKALPGLDENNPLSRVVERMTALDREDRYGSYEELLNDLVLVEQGQTITVPVRTGGTAIKKRRAAKAGNRRAAVIAAAVLLLAGGGGYAWYATRPAPVVPGPTPGDAGVLAAEQMTKARKSLAETGPSETLLADAKAIVPAESQKRDREALIADVQKGLTLKKKLEAVKSPDKLVPPFDDLKKHFAAVDAAAPPRGQVPAELMEWCNEKVRQARNEKELTSKAIRALTSDFTKWTADRRKAGNDAALLAPLRARLQVIDDGRRALSTMVPGSFDELKAVLPQQANYDARVGLDKNDAPVVDTDVSSSLAEVKQQFPEEGPTESLRNRVDKLRPEITDQIDERAKLLNDIDAAKLAKDDAFRIRNGRFPDTITPPFTAVADYYQALERAFAGLRTADGKLPPWAERLRTEYRTEQSLQASVLEACRSAYGRWQERQRAGAPSAELASGLQGVKAAIEAAVKLFPSLAKDLEGGIPAATLAAAEADLAKAGQRERWMTDATAWQAKLADVQTLADWQRSGADLQRDFEALKKGGEPFSTDADALRLLQRGEASTKQWGTALAKVGAAGKQFAAGDLTNALGLVRAGVSGNEGKAELTALGDAIVACRDAFTSIDDKLDVAEAKTLLAGARTKTEPLAAFLPGVGERIDRWRTGIEKFEGAKGGMVVIPAGKPKVGAPLGAFYLSPTECSRAEFAQFLADLRIAAGSGDDAARFAAVASRLEGSGMNAGRLRDLLMLDVKSDKQPIGSVSWYSAAAFAAWYGKALPTHAEWLLAALGDGGKYEFPWGNGWSTESSKRNTREWLVDVEQGGLSWREADGVRIHHLAGNVAEWLAADPAAREATLAGGRFDDNSESSVKSQARGELYTEFKDDARRGFGFRTVLRPKSFRALEWPR